MKEKFIENGIEYVRNGDYYIPNLKAPEGIYNIGKYGILHSIFIKENCPAFYSMKILDGTCLAYLEEIDTTARHYRGTKSKRPNGLGGCYEQHSPFGRRICVKRFVYSMEVRK